MINIKDQLGVHLNLDSPPKRIVSLVPSLTEYLYDLGLESEVIGITKFCIHPEKWHKTKTRVGGTKNVNHVNLFKLNPDLIIANKEENTKEDIEIFQNKYTVYTSDIETLEDCFTALSDIGILVNKQIQAERIISTLRDDFKNLIKPPKMRVLYFIWQKPYMLAANGTFINSLLIVSGFINSANNTDSRYPEKSLASIQQLNPDLLLLSSEPFRFKEKHRYSLEKNTGIKTMLVDGEMFSWYGSRLLKFKNYLKELKLKIET